MTVGELMEELGKYDKDLPVWMYADGQRVRLHEVDRTTFEHVWWENLFVPGGLRIEHKETIDAVVLDG